MSKDAIRKAVAIVGSQRALVRALGGDVTQQGVSHWCRTGLTAPELCRAIEIATGGQVTRYELRADVFGPASENVTADGQPAA